MYIYTFILFHPQTLEMVLALDPRKTRKSDFFFFSQTSSKHRRVILWTTQFHKIFKTNLVLSGDYYSTKFVKLKKSQSLKEWNYLSSFKHSGKQKRSVNNCVKNFNVYTSSNSICIDFLILNCIKKFRYNIINC